MASRQVSPGPTAWISIWLKQNQLNRPVVRKVVFCRFVFFCTYFVLYILILKEKVLIMNNYYGSFWYFHKVLMNMTKKSVIR